LALGAWFFFRKKQKLFSVILAGPALLLAGLTLLSILIGIVSGTSPFGSDDDLSTCEKIADDVIKLSEERMEGIPGGRKILKIYDIEDCPFYEGKFHCAETGVTDLNLVVSSVMDKLFMNKERCVGDARWSKGENSPIEFWWERDEDGD